MTEYRIKNFGNNSLVPVIFVKNKAQFLGIRTVVFRIVVDSNVPDNLVVFFINYGKLIFRFDKIIELLCGLLQRFMP